MSFESIIAGGLCVVLGFYLRGKWEDTRRKEGQQWLEIVKNLQEDNPVALTMHIRELTIKRDAMLERQKQALRDST